MKIGIERILYSSEEKVRKPYNFKTIEIKMSINPTNVFLILSSVKYSDKKQNFFLLVFNINKNKKGIKIICEDDSFLIASLRSIIKSL